MKTIKNISVNPQPKGLNDLDPDRIVTNCFVFMS